MITQRIQYFDQMKGIAIILVVVGHIMCCGIEPNCIGFGIGDTAVVNWLSIFNMPLFFYISGFLAYKSMYTGKPLLKQIWKKIRTIFLPFMVWCTLWCITHNEESLVHMLMRCGGKYWFLNTLAVLSVFFSIYEVLIKNVRNTYIYIGLWIIPFVVLLVCKLQNGGATRWISIDSLVNYYRYYLIGLLCSKYEWLNKLLFHNKIIYFFAVPFFVIELVLIKANNYFLAFAGAISAIIILQNLLMTISVNVNTKLRWLSYIGTRTLPIYLIHFFFIPDLKALSSPLAAIGSPFAIHLFLSLIVAGLVISITLVVERVLSHNCYLDCLLFGKKWTNEKTH